MCNRCVTPTKPNSNACGTSVRATTGAPACMPDRKLAPDKQAKRSVVALEPGDRAAWLRARVAEAQSLIQLPPVEIFDAEPANTE